MPLGEIKVLSDDIVTVPEAAKRLGKPKMTLYRWIKAKRIICFKLGGILFVPVTEVERLQQQWEREQEREAELQEKQKQEAEQKRRAEIERLERDLARLKNSAEQTTAEVEK